MRGNQIRQWVLRVTWRDRHCDGIIAGCEQSYGCWHCVPGRTESHSASIERFNNTVRQRVGRLVRQTLSFSKKLSNHIGAVWNFVHHYNASLQL